MKKYNVSFLLMLFFLSLYSCKKNVNSPMSTDEMFLNRIGSKTFLGDVTFVQSNGDIIYFGNDLYYFQYAISETRAIYKDIDGSGEYIGIEYQLDGSQYSTQFAANIASIDWNTLYMESIDASKPRLNSTSWIDPSYYNKYVGAWEDTPDHSGAWYGIVVEITADKKYLSKSTSSSSPYGTKTDAINAAKLLTLSARTVNPFNSIVIGTAEKGYKMVLERSANTYLIAVLEPDRTTLKEHWLVFTKF